MKIGIRHQPTYSRGELLLRTFFGIIYIGIPHLICLYFLAIAAAIGSFISFVSILIDGKTPRGVHDFTVKVMRWNLRVSARLLNLSDGYPAFGLNAVDPNTVVEIPHPENSDRGSALLRFFLGFFYVLIPHGVCLYFLAIAASFCTFIAWFAVLFTGQYPAGIHRFTSGVLRWGLRVNAYMLYLTDVYPPFTLEETVPVDWDNSRGVEEHLVG